ncbi:hypothetical protein BGZ99_003229 [Dissophora globulifera]|uniref:Uncharacterized protein n=1 Tax=Dissophora globulifera TaxID=979702 RepID=A0A9P6QUR9_9FUNG|nr:hypothetical protein BGZ99_003229 [Dissophora globulifera]
MLVKREPRNLLDAVVDLFVHAHTKVVADVCAHIKLDVCADVDIKLNVKAQVLGGLVDTDVDVEKLRLSAKAELDSDIDAKVKLIADAVIIAPIKASVGKILIELCPLLERECIKKNAHKIVVKVNSDIDLNIPKLWVKLGADLPAHIRARAKIIINRVAVHAGLVEAQVEGRVFIASNIDAHVEAWVKVWAKLYAKVKLEADIRAL